jgi:cytochrome oxidase Cu insertion factor (SCO1/SenC/PrrC family)
VKPQIVSNSLCTKRLNLLLQNQINNPLNRDIYKHSDTLSEENGIPELMNLYLDSNYDFSTGLFTSMSPETELKYHKDLTDFYTSFTQEDIMPDTIKSFSDIKLKDNFKKYDITIEDYQLSNKSLMKKYAENIKNMIQRIDFIQQKLLDILNDVFIINEHEDNIRISPLLTETKLQQFIEECRENIVELYIHCEEDFVEGINIYEAIIEDILLKTTISQISSLQDILDKIYTTTPS